MPHFWPTVFAANPSVKGISAGNKTNLLKFIDKYSKESTKPTYLE